MDELADKSTTGRLSKLKGKLAIPGWIALIWRLLWKPVGWLGNLDVMREHWNWIMKLAAALTNSGVVYALFTIGIAWLVIVVLYGDWLAQKFRPWKLILAVSGSMTVISIFAASAVKAPHTPASTQTNPRQPTATSAPPATAPPTSGNSQLKADDQAKGLKKLKIKKPQPEPKAKVSPSPAAQSPGTTAETNKVIDNVDVAAQHHEPKDTVTANVNASPSVPAQQPTFSVTNPSGSIINQGSTVEAPQTVNNYAPEWRISEEDKKALKAILSQSPAKVYVLAWLNDPLVVQYATDFNEVLKDSNWETAKIGVGGKITLSGGTPTAGVIIHVRGEPVPDGQIISVPRDSSIGLLGQAFEYLKIPAAIRRKQNEENLITVEFGSRPSTSNP